jgi:hypothetical protein
VTSILDSYQFGSCNAELYLDIKEINKAYSLDLARDLDEWECHLLACEFADAFN